MASKTCSLEFTGQGLCEEIVLVCYFYISVEPDRSIISEGSLLNILFAMKPEVLSDKELSLGEKFKELRCLVPTVASVVFVQVTLPLRSKY